MNLTVKRAAKVAAAVAIPASLMIAGAGAAAAAPAGHHHSAQLTVKQILNGMKLHHTYTPSGSAKPKREPLTLPDDITSVATNVFTAFQNGVGPQGQPSTDGNTDSTVVEFSLGGQEIHQWDIKGKCDGLTADPQAGVVTGTFPGHSVITAVTPCDANNAPPTCPAPGFPPNYVGVINPFTGHISKLHLSGPRLEPQGMHFVAAP